MVVVETDVVIVSVAVAVDEAVDVVELDVGASCVVVGMGLVSVVVGAGVAIPMLE